MTIKKILMIAAVFAIGFFDGWIRRAILDRSSTEAILDEQEAIWRSKFPAHPWIPGPGSFYITNIMVSRFSTNLAEPDWIELK